MSLKKRIKQLLVFLFFFYIFFSIASLSINIGNTLYSSAHYQYLIDTCFNILNPLKIFVGMLWVFPFTLFLLSVWSLFHIFQYKKQDATVLQSFAHVLWAYGICYIMTFSIIAIFQIEGWTEMFSIFLFPKNSNQMHGLWVLVVGGLLFFSWFVPLWNRHIRDWFFGNKATLF